MAHSTMTMTIMLIADNGENYVNINVKQTVTMTLIMMNVNGDSASENKDDHHFNFQESRQ